MRIEWYIKLLLLAGYGPFWLLLLLLAGLTRKLKYKLKCWSVLGRFPYKTATQYFTLHYERQSKGIPKWFLGEVFLLEAWGYQGQKNTIVLNMCDFLALVPQASKKTRCQQKHFGIPLSNAMKQHVKQI